jgi:hypothetical protein
MQRSVMAHNTVVQTSEMGRSRYLHRDPTVGPMRTLLFRTTLLVVALLALHAIHAQTYLITEPSITACSGTLYDSGGPSGAYAINERSTTVICPDTPGSRVRLAFSSTTQLSNQIEAPSDILFVHDGPDVQSPLIGTYSRNALADSIITASQGCLTLVFISNGSFPGNFDAQIGCVPGCNPFQAAFDLQGDTLPVCMGDSLLLDASASVALADTALLHWTWHVDGQVAAVTDTMPTALFFPAQGAHEVVCRTTDRRGCGSDPSEPLLVLVSEAPSFVGTVAPSPLCVNSTGTLLGQAVPGTMSLSSSASVSHGPGYSLIMPDQVVYAWAMQVDQYPEGAVLQDPDELGEVCLSLEHSYMGDLTFALVCPDGRYVRLQEALTGGGGIYLGAANDTTEAVVFGGSGTCWTYCWSASSTAGTMSANGSGTDPQVGFAGIPVSAALLPNTFTSAQPMDQLVGCPLNGTWTFLFGDLIASDNGSWCGWSMGLVPDPQGSFAELAPTLALDQPDSASWSGPWSEPTPVASLAQVTPAQAGAHTYRFTVVDSYGCAHDTTVQVTALNAPALDAGPDRLLCQDPQTLDGTVTPAPYGCTYQLILADYQGNGWDPSTSLTLLVDGVATFLTMPAGAIQDTVPIEVWQGQVIELLFTSTVPTTFDRYMLLNDEEERLHGLLSTLVTAPYADTVRCNGFTLPPVHWSPTIGVNDPTAATTTVAPPAAGWYVLTAGTSGQPCAVSDSVWVEVEGGFATVNWDPGTLQLCCTPNDLPDYAWYLNGALQTSGPAACLDNPAYGLWSVVASPTADCPWISEAYAYCPECELIQDGLDLMATPGLGTYAWALDGFPLPGATDATLPYQGNGLYTVTVTTPGGCVVQAELLVDINTRVQATSALTDLAVLPNPSTGRFQLRLPHALPGPLELRLLDLSGREVASRQLTALADGLSPLLSFEVPPGAYLLHLTDGELRWTARVVVQ